MVKDELAKAITDFIAEQQDDGKEEWYETDRDRTRAVLTQFAASIGLALQDDGSFVEQFEVKVMVSKAQLAEFEKQKAAGEPMTVLPISMSYAKSLQSRPISMSYAKSLQSRPVKLTVRNEVDPGTPAYPRCPKCKDDHGACPNNYSGPSVDGPCPMNSY